MSLLQVFKPQEQPLEFVLARKGPIDPRPQGMNGSVESSLSSTLRVLSMTRILLNIGDQASIEHARAIVFGIKSRVEIQIGPCECQTNGFGDQLQVSQALRK
jgi:hypothetical protein